MALLFWFFLQSSLAHDRGVHLSEIHVLGDNEQNSLLQYIPSVTTLSGHELKKRREISLGETLSSEAGVNATSFGPGASRPVIRGLDGDRIRILQNGLGTLDASSQSVDHAVPIDTLNVERIEVVRGPMSLLYGASAVGGVINIVNQRIHTQFEEGALTQFESQTQTGYGGMGNAARLDYGKNKWMLHLDASLRDYGDQRVPRYARSENIRSDEPITNEAKGRIKNSQVSQKSASVGASRIFDRGYVGLSLAHFSSDYGSVAEEAVEIVMRQNRWEFAGEYRFEESLFDKVRVRSAQSYYQHDEVEDGSTGTVFRNKGNETRLEFMRAKGDWKNTLGIQTQVFKFSAFGDEAYLPTSENQIASLFNFNEFLFGNNTLSFGVRAENYAIERKNSTNFGQALERNFTGLSASLGVLHKVNHLSYGLNYSYTERAPTFQELFSNGAHLATGIYEQGSDSLHKEKGNGLEASISHESDKLKGRLSVFGQLFHDYISLNPTGGTDGGSGFDISSYQAVDAQFYGADYDARLNLDNQWALLIKGDYVRGKDISNGQDLARLSPGRASIAIEYNRGNWLADAEVQNVFYQSKVPENDTKTDGYQLVNIGSSYDFMWNENRLNLFLRLKNLLDVEARQHVSPLKNIAPMVGRNIVMGMQLIF